MQGFVAGLRGLGIQGFCGSVVVGFRGFRVQGG